jgi:hypothetical protein
MQWWAKLTEARTLGIEVIDESALRLRLEAAPVRD